MSDASDGHWDTKDSEDRPTAAVRLSVISLYIAPILVISPSLPRSAQNQNPHPINPSCILPWWRLKASKFHPLSLPFLHIRKLNSVDAPAVKKWHGYPFLARMIVWDSTEVNFEMSKRYGESESWMQNAWGIIGVAAVYTTASPPVMTKAFLGARHS